MCTVATTVLAGMGQLYKLYCLTPKNLHQSLSLHVIINDPGSTNSNFVKRKHSTLSHYKNPIMKSPLPKKARRRRTGVEAMPVPLEIILTTAVDTIQAQQLLQSDSPTISIEQFELQQEENSFEKLGEICEQYIILKLANEQNQKFSVGIQMYYCLSQNVPSPDKTSIIYFKVLDEQCDNKETLLSIINDLYKEFYTVW